MQYTFIEAIQLIKSGKCRAAYTQMLTGALEGKTLYVRLNNSGGVFFSLSADSNEAVNRAYTVKFYTDRRFYLLYPTEDNTTHTIENPKLDSKFKIADGNPV